MRRLWLVSFLVVMIGGQLGVGTRAARTASVTGDEPFYLWSWLPPCWRWRAWE